MQQVGTTMIDMRGNLAAGIIIALTGAVLVRSMKPPAITAAHRRWIPAVALISGPLLTVGWFVADTYYFSEFVHPDDFVPRAISAVIIGLVAGAIGATAFWIVERKR